MTMLKNGGWHSMGQYYSILRTTPCAQLLQNTLDADGDGRETNYEIRRADGSARMYARKSSALRAWRRLAADTTEGK